MIRDQWFERYKITLILESSIHINAFPSVGTPNCQQRLEGLRLRREHEFRFRGIWDGGESATAVSFQFAETQRDDQQWYDWHEWAWRCRGTQ